MNDMLGRLSHHIKCEKFDRLRYKRLYISLPINLWSWGTLATCTSFPFFSGLGEFQHLYVKFFDIGNDGPTLNPYKYTL